MYGLLGQSLQKLVTFETLLFTLQLEAPGLSITSEHPLQIFTSQIFLMNIHDSKKMFFYLILKLLSL